MELWAIKYQLVNAAPEYVFEWLKNNTVDEHSILSERDQLENSLLSRNEKLINLSLALYGEVPSVGYSLFKSDDPIIKRAALSGRSVRPVSLDESWVLNDDVLPALLEEEKQNAKSDTDDDGTRLLNELLNNKFLPSEILEAVYEKSGHFSGVDDNLWINMVMMSTRNERLSTPYNSTLIDGFDEYTYNNVFSAAWRLFREFPVSKKAAHVLIELSNRLVPECPYDMKALDVADRWRSKDEKNDGTFSYVRTALVNIVRNYSEFKDLKDHEDVAIRMGYYANLEVANPDDVSNGLEKDGEEFLFYAINNDSFFTNEETRRALKQACRDVPYDGMGMDYRNYFNSQAEYLSTKHPEWFKDSWSGELPFEEIKDAEERREKRLEYLNTQVAELHKALLGDKDEYHESNEFADNSILNDLRPELQQIGEHLGKLYQKSTFPWGWLVAGAALGFMLGKY